MNKTAKNKITFIGDSTAGKTTIVQRLVTGNYNKYITSTIGLSYTNLKIDGLNFELWDTAGQERFRSLVKFYYRETDIFIFVFDCSNPQTVNSLEYYIDSIFKDIKNNFKLIIIGNKIDLIDKDQINSVDKLLRHDIEKNKDKLMIDPDIIYASAKTGENFQKITEYMMDYSLHKDSYHSFEIVENTKKTVNLDPTDKKTGSYADYCYC